MLDHMAERLAKTKKEKVDMADELERARAREEEAMRGFEAASAAREQAKDRERAINEQKLEDAARIRDLEARLSALLAQRADLEKEMQDTRSAMRNVEANVKTLCDARHRIRTGGGG